MENTKNLQTVREKIKQRRLQMIVHSCLYYRMNENIVSDATWSKWAVELRDLQNQYPEIAREVEYAEYFEGWDGSSGFDLPIDDPEFIARAEYLLNLRLRRV